MRVLAKNTLFLSLGIVPALAFAQASELQLRLERCAVLGDASARLACYDGLANVATPDREAEPARTQPAAPPPEPKVPAKVAALTTIAPEDTVSRMVQEWELDRASKRGVFNFRPHKDTYLLLANYSSASNDAPFQEFTPAGIKSKHVELTYQISFKMKLIEQLMSTPVDLWFGYTQNSFWQAYNRAASSPFRETNYQPEMMLTTPLNLNLGLLETRYLTLGLNHQSNGQTSTLSRSWNRIYAEVGAEKGKFGVSFRLWKRLDNARSDNDNIDITDFLGHGDLTASYRFDGNELSVMARRNFGKKHGALRVGWSFPVAANLKGYVQGFSGYGQSLIDYNYSQKSVGAGFLVDF
jgi:phospholipase A1